MSFKHANHGLLVTLTAILVGCTQSATLVHPDQKVDGAAVQLIVKEDGEIQHKDVTLNEVLLDSQGVVLVDFWATWCGPCRMLEPELKKVAMARPDVVVLKVNVDTEPLLAEYFRVSAIPDMRIFENGKATDQIRSFQTAADIQSRLK